MEQFVDAVKTSVTNGPASEVCIMQTARMATLNFWTIYIPSLRNRMLLHQIHPEVVVGRPFVMVSVTVVLQSKCRGKRNVAYVNGVIVRHVPYAVTGDDCKMCHIPSVGVNQCLRIFQRAWGGGTVSNPSFWKGGAHGEFFSNSVGWYNGKCCSIIFTWWKNYNSCQEHSWFWMDSVFWLFHHQEIVDGILRNVRRISVPWW